MSFKSINFNYIFNKEYYDNITEPLKDRETEEDRAKKVNSQFFETGAVIYNFNKSDTQKFFLQVRYPGLLVGIGNTHETGTKGEIGLGFTFDYVTGVPYLPGSTVKGILKSAFSKKGYIEGVLEKSNDEVKPIENEIFEGVVANDDKNTGLPIGMRDVFYDAFPSSETPKENNDNKFYLIAPESITPHGNDPFKSPNPLTLVKIKPGVIFEFPFKLHNGIISANEKLQLFKTILMDFGAGANTNVGFGVLAEVDKSIKCSSPKPESSFETRKSNYSNQKKVFNKYNKKFDKQKENDEMNKLLFVDAETNGLYGETLSIAAVLCADDAELSEMNSFYGAVLPTLETLTMWVRENVYPHLNNAEKIFNSETELLEAFWHFYSDNCKNCLCIADVPYPVEFSVFRKCVALSFDERRDQAPFPLLDFASMLYAKGINPLENRQNLSSIEIVQHDAMNDVHVTIYLWRKLFCYNG